MTEQERHELAQVLADSLRGLDKIAADIPDCARCHHPWDEHTPCCNHYAPPEPGRVDPICYCREYVAKKP